MTRDRARVLLILLFLTAKLYSCCAEFCKGPEKQIQNGTFILRGPCPSENSLFVPVSDSVLYRCDNEKTPSDTYLPLWNISGLSGSPFLNNKGSEHSITETQILPGNAVNTTLNILVRELYLMEAINIQCGLCSLSACLEDNPLQENIISDPVILVAFSESILLYE